MTSRSVRAALIAALLLHAAPAAHAEPAHSKPAPGKSAASREFLVEGDGGAYQVPVHPDFVTVLYFPDSVIKAQASDQKNFTISAMGDTISLRPVSTDVATRANLNVVTKSMKVTVILEVAASPDQAVAQVFFKPASVEREMRERVAAEVDRRVAALEAAQKKRLAALPDQIRSRADRELASRMLARHQELKLKAIARNDANVIVRARRAVLIGDDAYLFFEIQNRSGRNYRLERVALQRGTGDLASLVEFEKSPGEATAKLLGVIPDASRRRGVVVVRDADRVGASRLTLVVAEPGGKNEVRVGGIELR